MPNEYHQVCAVIRAMPLGLHGSFQGCGHPVAVPEGHAGLSQVAARCCRWLIALHYVPFSDCGTVQELHCQFAPTVQYENTTHWFLTAVTVRERDVSVRDCGTVRECHTSVGDSCTVQERWAPVYDTGAVRPKLGKWRTVDIGKER